MAIRSACVRGEEESARGALPSTIQSWAMVDPLLGTVLEIRGHAGCHTQPLRLRDITRTAAAILVPTTTPRSK